MAASSRPKALAAWSVRLDIFASGLPPEVKDCEDAAAAGAAPGETIQGGLAVDVGAAVPRKSPARSPPNNGTRSCQPHAGDEPGDQLDRGRRDIRSLTLFKRAIQFFPIAGEPLIGTAPRPLKLFV